MANIIVCDMCGKRLNQEDYCDVRTKYVSRDPNIFSKSVQHNFCTECLNAIRESIRTYRHKQFGSTVPTVTVLLDEFLDPYGDYDVEEYK